MQKLRKLCAGINYRLLVLLTAASTALAGGLLAAHAVRKQSLLRTAFAEGSAAYARQDWPRARVELGRWIAAHPNDLDVLRIYAEAHLAADPLLPENVRQATSALRRVLRLDPNDRASFQRLAQLYEASGNAAELLHVATRRLQLVPGEPAAALAAAKALAQQRKTVAAISQLTDLIAGRPRTAAVEAEVVEACVLLAELIEQEPRTGPSGDAATWLDHAVALAPHNPMPRAVRSAYRRALSEQLADSGDAAAARAQREAARADLECATELLDTDPRVWLLVMQEWAAQGVPQRVRALLAVVAAHCGDSGRPYFVDPADWAASLATVQAELALQDPEGIDPVALADALLAGLADRPQRALLLPLATQLYLRGGAVEDARRALDEYRDAVNLSPSAAQFEEQLQFLEATLARAEGRYHEVIRRLEPGMVTAAPRPGSARLLVEAYERTGQEGRLLHWLGKPDRASRLPRDLRRRLARLMMQTGDYAGARDVLGASSAAPASAADDQVLWWTATLSLAAARGEHERSAFIHSIETPLRALRESHPQRADVRILMAALYELRGHAEAARAELESAVAECEDAAGAWLALAEWTARQGKPPGEILREACRRAPRPALWIALANALARAGELHEAREALAQAASSATSPPERRIVDLERARLELEHGDREAGVAAVHQAAAAARQDARPYVWLLRLPETSDAEAEAAIARLREIEGEDGVRWRTERARWWLRSPEWRTKAGACAELLEACLVTDPTASEAALLLGELRERLGDQAGAESAYRAVDSPQTRQALLMLMLRQQRFTDARTLLERDQPSSIGGATAQAMLNAGLDDPWAAAVYEPRSSGPGPYTVDQRVVLAALGYSTHGRAEEALSDLDEAERLGADPIAVARVRTALLEHAGRPQEAAAKLDELVGRENSPEALLLRGAFHAAHGRAAAAEQDYVALARSATDDFGPAMLGEYYAQARRWDEAIAAWDAGLVRFAESTRLRRGLSKALLSRGRPGDLERVGALLDALERALPDDVDVLWVRALERVKSDPNQAADVVRALAARAAGANSGPAEAFSGLAEIALRVGAVREARATARRGIELHPADAGLQVTLARVELAAGNLEAADEWVRGPLSQGRPDLRTLETAAAVALERRDTALIERLLEDTTVLAGWGAQEQAVVLRARLLKAVGRNEAARDVLRDWEAQHAGTTGYPALVLLAELHRATGDAAAARRVLEEIVLRTPEGAARPRECVQLELELLAAEQRFDELAGRTEHDPDVRGNAHLLVLAASLLLDSPAHLVAAEQACARALQIGPRSVEALATAANIAYRRRDLAGAMASYRELLAMRPEHPEALNNAAWTLSQGEGDASALREAEGFARKAVALVPTEANYRDTLGTVLHRSGRLRESREEFRRGAALAPKGSSLRLGLLLRSAQLSEALGDREGVQADLREATGEEFEGTVFTPEQRDEVERLSAFARTAARPLSDAGSGRY